MKDILFKKVNCNAYLKKVYDTKFIDIDQDTLTAEYVTHEGYVMSKTQSSCEGDLDFLKTYYELTKKDFTGFAVGIKDICATGYLVVDTCFHYNGSEHLAIRKEPKDIYKCAIVYYGNNRKRFVPVENIKLTRE